MLILSLVAALLVGWTVLYLRVIGPKLHAFRSTAGIYAAIDAAEASLLARARLWLKGLKVLIAGVVTSALPLVPVVYEKISGVDWATLFPSTQAKLIAALVTAAGIAGPMLMVALHNAGLAEAAAVEPKA